jgi:hypothetical protein
VLRPTATQKVGDGQLTPSKSVPGGLGTSWTRHTAETVVFWTDLEPAVPPERTAKQQAEHQENHHAGRRYCSSHLNLPLAPTRRTFLRRVPSAVSASRRAADADPVAVWVGENGEGW